MSPGGSTSALVGWTSGSFSARVSGSPSSRPATRPCRRTPKQATGTGGTKRAAKRAGVLVGAYYYATPTSDRRRVVRDARAQARKAVARVGGRFRPGHLPLALDLETEATRLGKADLTRWSIAWLRTVEKRTGRTPWFYSYTRYMERRLLPDPRLLRFPLWHANWGLFWKDRPMQVRAGRPTMRGSGNSRPPVDCPGPGRAIWI